MERIAYPINVVDKVMTETQKFWNPIGSRRSKWGVKEVKSSSFSAPIADGEYRSLNATRIEINTPGKGLQADADVDANEMPSIAIDSTPSRQNNPGLEIALVHPQDLPHTQNKPADMRLFNIAPMKVEFLTDKKKTACHHCRTSTYATMKCTNMGANTGKLCTARYCHRCIYIRFVHDVQL